MPLLFFIAILIFPQFLTFASNLSISAPLCLSQTYGRIFVRYLSIPSLIFLLPCPSILLSLLSYCRPSFFLSFLLSFFLSFLPSFLPYFLPSFFITSSAHPSIPSLPFLFSTIFSSSYQCMEATPSLACANKCVFCWRHHKNPVGTEWRYGNFIMLKCSTP